MSCSTMFHRVAAVAVDKKPGYTCIDFRSEDGNALHIFTHDGEDDDAITMLETAIAEYRKAHPAVQPIAEAA